MSIFRKSLAGAIGGLAGAWAMQQFRLRWDARANADADSGIFGFDEEADIKSVDQICAALSLPPLSEPEALAAALWLHYGYGVTAGAAYAILVSRRPKARAGFGTAFGAALWLIGDEAAITASSLSNPWSRKPAAHVSALAAHLLFGVVTEGGRRGVTKLLHHFRGSTE